MFQVLIVVVAVMAAVSLDAGPQAPGQQPPTFRVEVNYVEIDAHAVAQGRVRR
jgi:hypothetical protein